jgi:hypothetical protein
LRPYESGNAAAGVGSLTPRWQLAPSNVVLGIECNIMGIELNRYAVETAFHFFSLSYVSSRRLTIALEQLTPTI